LTAQRQTLAKQIGLGRKPAPPPPPIWSVAYRIDLRFAPSWPKQFALETGSGDDRAGGSEKPDSADPRRALRLPADDARNQ